MHISVLSGQQAGKRIFTGMLSAADIVNFLKSGVLSVNPEAQRSLAKGAGKETTRDLIAGDRVQKTPRMMSITKFFHRVMDRLEEGGTNFEGFFGAVQLAVPEAFTGGRLLPVGVGDDVKEKSGSLARFLDSLGAANVGTFVASPTLGEAAIHIVDGQARCVGFLSFEKAVLDEIERLKKRIRKLEKSYESTREEKARLAEHEELLARIRHFLTSTHVPFVLYVDSVNADGRVVGLPLVAEKRLYIEGNALNSQASKEEVIKYEAFSPVVLELQALRMEPDYGWMSSDFIEEDSKSIGLNSSKVFTLSALVQAYSFSVVGHNQPIKRVDEDMFRQVGERLEFTRAFWREVSDQFGPLWTPDLETVGERVEYLRERRVEQHVACQAIFLQALGKLGYQLGRMSEWEPSSPLLKKLRLLNPQSVNYLAQDGSKPDGYNPLWKNAMMKPVTDKVTGAIERYVFNNVADSVSKTFHILCEKIGLDVSEEFEVQPEEADLEPAEMS